MRFWFRKFLAGLLFVTTAPVYAQTTYTWTGAASGKWGTAANWSPNGVPGQTGFTDRVIFGPSARTAVTVASANGFDIDTLAFAANAPNYSFSLSQSAFYVEGGITNAAPATHPSFSIAGDSCLCVYAGDFANSVITNSGKVLADGATTLGAASIDNKNGATVQVEGTDSNAASILNEAGGYVAIGDSDIQIGSISGAGNVNIGQEHLTLGALDRDETIGGLLDGTTGGSLTKTGSGTLTLTDANIYSGKTEVAGGMLEVDGSLASSEVQVDSGKAVGGRGTINTLVLQNGASLFPGNASPDTYLSVGSLFCAPTPEMFLRIGGGDNGTRLIIRSALQNGFCHGIHVRFDADTSGVTANVDYPVIVVNSTTDWTPANLSYDFNGAPGLSEAQGQFDFVTLGSTATIISFKITDLGNEIFRNGFELLN